MYCCESWKFEGKSCWRTKKWTKGPNECQTSVRLQIPTSKFRRKWSKVQVKMETGKSARQPLVNIGVGIGYMGGPRYFLSEFQKSMFWPTGELSEWEKWGKVMSVSHLLIQSCQNRTEKQINFRACLLTFLHCVFSNIVKLRKSCLMVLARWVVSPYVPMQTCFTANDATCSGLIQNVEEIQNNLHKPEVWNLINTKGSQTDQY